MPKLKTRKAAAKRFQRTGSGKFTRRHAKTRHLLECKSAKKMKALGGSAIVDKADTARVRLMLAGS